ncbi:MAG: hypothetical protein L3J32_07190 [Rhizobiaceae bacterium]|nr:hypothetical protein [Rhizobiaceae bacterium]
MNANNMNTGTNDEDAPLDPAVERVRAKMMRLMGISVAIMMVGLMAVIGAIFYKIYGGEEENTAQDRVIEQNVAGISNGEIDIPQGSKIVKAELSGGQILLTLEKREGGIALWVYDMANNQVTAKITVNQ